MFKNNYLYFVIKILFIFFASFVNASNQKINLKIFDFNEDYSSERNKKAKYYTFEDLILRSLEFGLDCQEKTQMVFQAKRAVKVKLSNILPQINLISIADSALNRSLSVETFVPFVGFLFPGRWYDWQAAKYLRQAEGESLAALFADKAQVVQNLYFNIELQLWSIRVLKFYVNEINNIIDLLKKQRKVSSRRVSAADIAVLQNIKGKLGYDLAFTDSLSSLLPQLATALGNKPDFDWATLEVEPHKIQSVKGLTKRKYSEFWYDALTKAPEIKNIQFLILASKKNRKKFYFDFLDPDSGNNLGFGYGSSIKMSRSSTGILEVQLERSKMSLSNAIQDALNNYNDSVDSFPGIILGLKQLEHIRADVESHLNDKKVALDINKIIRFFDYSVGQALRYVGSYFVLRSAEANLNRYTWNGKVYRIVNEYIYDKVPGFLIDIKKMYSNKRTIMHKVLRIHGPQMPLMRDTSLERP